MCLWNIPCQVTCRMHAWYRALCYRFHLLHRLNDGEGELARLRMGFTAVPRSILKPLHCQWSDVCRHLMMFEAEESFVLLPGCQSSLLSGGTCILHWLLRGPGEESVCWSGRSRGGGRAGKRKCRQQSLPFLLFRLDRQELMGSSIVFSPCGALGQPGSFA